MNADLKKEQSQWSLTFEVRKRRGRSAQVVHPNSVAMEPDL